MRFDGGFLRNTALKSRNLFHILHFNLYSPPSNRLFSHKFVGLTHPQGGQSILQSVNMCHYATHSGFDGQLGAVVEACFDQHTVDVCLYRSLGYVKPVGNFGI